MKIVNESEKDGIVEVCGGIEGEHDGRLGRVRVESAVVLLVVLLFQHGGVLGARHGEVGLALVKSHHPGVDAVGGLVLAGIAVERDEQVGMVVVGDFGAAVEFHKHIRVARIYHLDIRAVVADKLTRLQRDVQGDILLLGISAEAAGILATVACVNHHFEGFPVFLGGHRECQKSYEQK